MKQIIPLAVFILSVSGVYSGAFEVNQKPGMDKSILIIGAGASGIAAATRLISNGFKNVEILEAENRIGGRINTIPFGANVLDMGAQWCQGETGNIVYELAKDKNLLQTSIDKLGYYTFIRSDGHHIPREISTKLLDNGLDIFKDDKYKGEKQHYNGSLGNFFAEKYNKMLKTDEFKDVDSELAQQTFDLLHGLICTEDASDSWYETSCHNRFEWSDGDWILGWKDKGFVTVLDLLQKKLPVGNPKEVIDIVPFTLFNKTVQKIIYNHPDGFIRAECEDGSRRIGSHVILTVPLGVLKARHLSMFEPFLPLSKINAINGLNYGVVDKIYLEFDKPFWNDDWAGFSILWKLEQLKEIQEDPINGDWLDGIVGVYSFNSHQPNVLCFWISGEKARKMEEKNDDDVKAGAEKILRMFLNNWTIPNAKNMARSKWHTNPNFRGSYSSYTLKSNALNASAEQLMEPILDLNGKPIIQFAGEATSINHYAVVHGAIETGWREADRIINLYK